MRVQPTAYVDGLITPLEEAKIPLLDRGFLYGDSVYEVFRTYDGVPLFWEEHFDRQEKSASLIHMPITQTREQMLDAIRETVSTARVDDGNDDPGEVYVRFHLSRGVGPVDLFPDPQLKTSFMVIVKPVPEWNPIHYSEGLQVAVTDVRRNSDDSLSPNIKSGNYLNNILALAEATSKGADDCLMLNASGELTEASNSNVFYVIDGVVKTASRDSGILDGITGQALRQISKEADWAIEDCRLGLEDLKQADEAFVTSATREVMPIRAVLMPDGKKQEFPAGGGGLTRKIAASYKQFVTDYSRSNIAAKLW